MSSRARVLLLAFLALTALACVRLGLWQLSRLRERRAVNAAAAAARARPVADLNAGEGGTLAHRRVRAVGEYDAGHEMLVRGQAMREQPGVHVVTPLRLAGRREGVLVLRGFVPSADAVSADLTGLGAPGERSVTGVALPLTSGRGMPLERNGVTTWRRLDLDGIRARLPYPILDVVLVQAPDSSLPRFPRRIVPPALDDGPHRDYAIQWFAFAITALVVGAVIVRWPPAGVTGP